jgi:hypothetical protein
MRKKPGRVDDIHNNFEIRLRGLFELTFCPALGSSCLPCHEILFPLISRVEHFRGEGPPVQGGKLGALEGGVFRKALLVACLSAFECVRFLFRGFAKDTRVKYMPDQALKDGVCRSYTFTVEGVAA